MWTCVRASGELHGHDERGVRSSTVCAHKTFRLGRTRTLGLSEYGKMGHILMTFYARAIRSALSRSAPNSELLLEFGDPVPVGSEFDALGFRKYLEEPALGGKSLLKKLNCSCGSF